MSSKKEIKKSLPIVLPIKEENDEEWAKDIHPNLPKPPSVICIYASFRSGKSVLVNNFILNPNFLRGMLDKWFIFSPTARNDQSSKYLLDEEGVEIIDDYTDDYLNALLQFQKETPKEERDKIGIVFDDAIQYLHSRNSAGNFLATRFRHYNIKYLFYVSQSFRALDTKVRANSKGVIIMKISNLKELDKLEEEYGAMIGNRFIDLYNYCLDDKPFSFLYINIDANPVEAYLRFERKIFPSDEFPAVQKTSFSKKLTKTKGIDEESMSEIKNRHLK